jgi:hypothetical protein
MMGAWVESIAGEDREGRAAPLHDDGETMGAKV